HWALFARYVLHEGEMNDVHRSDLKERHIKLLKQVCFLDGERCRAEGDATRLAMSGGFDMLLRGELVGGYHFAQRAEVLPLIGVGNIASILFVRDERFVGPGLKLHCLCARLCG